MIRDVLAAHAEVRSPMVVRAQGHDIFVTVRSGGVRTIGIAAAGVKIGLQNPAYNIRRLVALERAAIGAM